MLLPAAGLAQYYCGILSKTDKETRIPFSRRPTTHFMIEVQTLTI